MKQPKKPDWITKLLRNRKARERYFMKRYGSLDKLHEKEAELLRYMNEISMEMEIDECD